MIERDAVRLAQLAASRAHVAKNAFQADIGLRNLAEAVERLAQAVAALAFTESAGSELSSEPDDDVVYDLDSTIAP